jgi:hypothetical protein
MVFVDDTVTQDIDDLMAFPLADDDVLVVGFVKSGTSWLQLMITELSDGLNTCGEAHKVPSLHGGFRVEGQYYGYADCLRLPSPRLMKTHLPRQWMPERWPEHGKVVHIARNPKDVCVSLFHEMKNRSRTMAQSETDVLEFAEYLRLFMAHQVPWAPIADHLVGWRQYDHPNLLKVTYEETRSNPVPVLRAIAEFLGSPVSSERIDAIARATAFDAMRANSALLSQINHPDLRQDSDAPFMRKGVVGDWKEWLTVAQNDRFDREIVRQIEAGGVFLTYE